LPITDLNFNPEPFLNALHTLITQGVFSNFFEKSKKTLFFSEKL